MVTLLELACPGLALAAFSRCSQEHRLGHSTLFQPHALVYFLSQTCSKQGFPKLFLALDSPPCSLHAHSTLVAVPMSPC